ncbi:hypothetical protein V2J09_004256 [Rumex salicifolius]
MGVGGASNDPVKLEVVTEDELEEEIGPFNKRMKQSSFPDQLITGNDLLPVPPSQYNPLEEPSPLGLRLKKSPSLLELIQMRLAQGNTSSIVSSSSSSSSKVNTDCRERATRASISIAAPSSNDKLKASNFPASLLRIGHWEYASKYEGDLVAKCYFAKHKLVWEVLDGGLKSKIEIQWSDIMGLNAKFPEDGPATMTVVLARQPLFFRETNPQPRKHTLWQATADFTSNQASTHRQHFVQVPLGVLNKHFEKLIQCDAHLNFLCRQPKMVLDSPYFESLALALEDSKDSLIHTMDPSIATDFSTFPDGASQSVLETSLIVRTEQANLARTKNLLHEAPSPSSVMDKHATEGCVSSDAESLGEPKKWELLIMNGLRPSMSMTDLVNHIGSCISGQCNTNNSTFAEEGTESREILQDIAQHLLGDSQVTCSDEKSLMKRVNSLCSLLNKDGTPVKINAAAADKGVGGSEDQKDAPVYSCVTESTSTLNSLGSAGESKELSSCKPSISRKDSYGDLLLNLPRIASLPTFLFDISEDDENQAR